MIRSHPAAPSQSAYFRPILPVFVTGPTGGHLFDGLIDTGSDDIVFPDSAAVRLGLDLKSAVSRRVGLAGRPTMTVQYAILDLRITDGRSEVYDWTTFVGFAPVSLSRVLLGTLGFLEFFDFTLRRSSREFELVANSTFTGTRPSISG